MFDKLFGNKKNKITSINSGSHGDHWSGMFGFETISKSKDPIINALNGNIQSTEIKKAGDDSIIASEYKEPGVIVLVNSNKEIFSGFPFLESKTKITFSMGELIEWSHIGGKEGQIHGGGNKSFALTFYATDYLENKSKYLSEKEIMVCLSGFIYVLDVPAELPSNFSEDFTTYMPNQTANDVFDFIANVLDVKQVKLPTIEGYLLKLGMVNDEKDKYQFILETFVNKENMRIPTVKVGDKVSGAFWLQGSIAE